MKDRYFPVARSALERTVGKPQKGNNVQNFVHFFDSHDFKWTATAQLFISHFDFAFAALPQTSIKSLKIPKNQGVSPHGGSPCPRCQAYVILLPNAVILRFSSAQLQHWHTPSPHPPSPKCSFSQALLGPPGAIWGMSAYVMTRKTYAQRGNAGVVAAAAATKCWKKSQKIAINHENIQGGLEWLWRCPGMFWEVESYVLETVWHVSLCLRVNAVVKLPVSAVAKVIWEFQDFRHMPVRTLALTYLKWAWTFQKRQLHQSGSTSWELLGSGFRTCPGTLDLLECPKNTSLNRKNTPKIFMEGPDLSQLTWFNLILEAQRWGYLLKMQTWAASFKTAEA